MSEAQLPAYVQDGFYGPTALVAAAKQAVELDPRVGGTLPAAGLPPESTDEAGTEAMFGYVATEKLPIPAGCKRANSTMVTRMMGSSF